MKKLVLGSASPRRKELLSVITPDFTVKAADADESLPSGIDPVAAVELLSRRKAEAVFGALGNPADTAVLGADTVVFIDGLILGKPHSHEEAVRMIGKLSGRRHTVSTGVTLLGADFERTFHETTDVDFYPLTEEEIAWYCSLREPYDKAGAYGIQGQGALLVSGIRGDYYNVMGLPLSHLARELRALGLLPPLHSV